MPLRERERVRVDPERLVLEPLGHRSPARVDRLAPDEKRLLQAAAVIGKDVPLAVLRTIAAVAEDVLQHGLATLQAGEFLHEARLFPDLEYSSNTL